MIAGQAEERPMLEQMLFQVYQALGNSRLALLHHIRYADLNDSIFNSGKIKQFQTLQVRYETRQRKQALQLEQLENQKGLVQLHDMSLQRNITLGGIIFLPAGGKRQAADGKRPAPERDPSPRTK